MNFARFAFVRASFANAILLLLIVGNPAVAQANGAGTTLTYIAGSSVKVEQVIGDCDWAVKAANGTCLPTASQTVTRFNILGNDVSSSFEDNGRVIFLFGDTISGNPGTVKYMAHDPIAWSTSTDPEAGLVLNFFTNTDGSPLFIEPPGVAMGADDVPNAGISLSDGIYLVCNTGSDTSLANPHQNDRSVLAHFDESTRTFTTGRTVSSMPDGHFINTTLHASGSDVLMFGAGAYRASDIYLAMTPSSSFAAGTGTQYFAGLVNGQPTWTSLESGAEPVVQDNPTGAPAWPNDSPTVGNVSVAYSTDLNLWLMTYDGGRQSAPTRGAYFTYAQHPWGPWSAPQLIFNEVRDNAYGVFIHNPSIVPDPPGDGLNGPTIGNNDPYTTAGGAYAPLLIERFTRVAGDTLKIYYTLSTWNPYTVVRMRSEFKIAPAPGAPTPTGTVIEYYDPDLKNFFITADPVEQGFVDTGAVGRWQRTGNAFEAGGPDQVCRFYGNANVNPVTGAMFGPNSHFYTADASECAGLKALYTPGAKSWKFESNDFATTPAVNGGCASGLVPVYRAYNNGFAQGIDSNHRITSNLADYQSTVAGGWTGEGIVMCAPPLTKPAGLYIDSNALPLTAANAATLASSLTVPGADGLVLVLGWNQVEPGMGQYQWDTLDQWMNMAISAGIKVELSVRADLAPAWLFQAAPGGAGANPLNFSYAAQGGSKPCSSETIAAPWDPAFLSRWDALLAAVAAHLKSAGTYNAVTLLRLTGINRNSDELHLPAQTPQSTGSACVSDAVSTWLQVGYRPSLLLRGWDGITGSFKRSFPDKYFSIAIIASTFPFPPIAEDGTVITSVQGLGAAQNLPLLTLASQKFPGQLVIQNNSLYPNEPAQTQTVQSAQSLGTLVAFQTNEDFGATYGGAGCGARTDATPTPCTAATFLQMLETGIYPLGKSNSLRAQYIEVFAANVNAFPGAILQAHGELVP